MLTNPRIFQLLISLSYALLNRYVLDILNAHTRQQFLFARAPTIGIDIKNEHETKERRLARTSPRKKFYTLTN